MKMKLEFKKISIIGLGLIGTSILHAINAKQKEGVTTFAYDMNSKHRDIVSEMKIATFVCDEIHDAIKTLLHQKAAEKVSEVTPAVASGVFGDTSGDIPGDEVETTTDETEEESE